MVNLGCRVNRVECDLIARQLEEAGFSLGPQTLADVVIVNTCAVTGEAEAKTRKAIRRAARMPQHPLVIATGCVASLFADSLAALAPNVRVVASKSEVARSAIAALGGSCAGVPLPPHATPTPTGRTRPGIKVQDGCDLRCSYCIVWKARGASASTPVEQVVAQVENAVAGNAREVVLTGINLGCYAHAGRRLPDLLEALLEQTQVGRLRLSSIEPQDVDDRLIELMAASRGRIAPYLHVCLQSGSDSVLRRMARIYTADEFAGRVERAYAAIGNLAVETDLIVAFPGETEEEFEESRAFCERMRFSHIHVFRYSKRPGTRAAELPDQVPPAISAERSGIIRSLSERMRYERACSFVGTDDLVITQAVGRGVTGGLFECTLDQPLASDALVPVRIARAAEDATLKAVVL